MSDHPVFSEHPSYSEIAASSLWIVMNPPPKKDNECNLCGQTLAEVKSKDVPDRKSFYACLGCKTVKQSLEDKSVKIVIE